MDKSNPVLHPTAQLLLKRKSERSRPGQRNDNRRVALAIEGGGMRGIIGGAMVAAFEQLDMLECFDAVYGSSAGAISGAYFVAKQARYGVTIFYENINNTTFVDVRRGLLGRRIVNVDFLLDDVCISQKPLNAGAVIDSPVPLRVIATSLADIKRVTFSNFQNAAQLFNALRCSARIPVFSGPPVIHEGQPYYDASVTESIPYKAALEDGYTDVVALLTRPAGTLRGSPDLVDRFLVAPRLRSINPDLPEVFLRRSEQYKAEVMEILHSNGSDGQPPILPVQMPSYVHTISSRETNRAKLVAGAKAGYAAVYAALGLPDPGVLEVMMPTSAMWGATN